MQFLKILFCIQFVFTHMVLTRTLIIAIILAFLSGWSFGQTDDLRKKNFNVKKEVALDGFDPVSYFAGSPVEGNPKIRFQYKGVSYQFVSQTNLNQFRSTPDKYEPAYGGWCAYAMGETGEKVKVDPETYTILDGRLYLFYNFWGNNTFVDWKKNEKKLKERADQNWKQILR